MTTTIRLGKAGRLVIPKSIRDNLGLHEGSRLRIEASSGKFEAILEPDEVQIIVRDGLSIITGGKPRRKGDIVSAIKADRALRKEIEPRAQRGNAADLGKIFSIVPHREPLPRDEV